MDSELDPRQAAALLDETRLRARRALEPCPPWLLVVRAGLALVAGGVLWLSVRDQHPYRHPSWLALGLVAPLLVVNLLATWAAMRRAGAGVRGPSRLRGGEIAIMAGIWVAAFAVLAGMAGSVSDEVVYGWDPAAVPLIAAGAAWAVFMALRARWRAVVTGAAIAVVGVLDLFAGPVRGWAVAGVGICVVLLANAVVAAWRQRAA